MNKLGLLFFVSLLLASNIFAYRVELNTALNIGEAKVDAGNDGTNYNDKISLGLGGTFYFEDVKTDKGPLDEATFLNKSSSVTIEQDLSYDYNEIVYRFDEGVYGKSTTLAAKGVINDYILFAQYDYGKLHGGFENEEVKQQKLTIGAGKYLSDYSTITVAFISLNDTRTYVPAVGFGVNYREDKGLDTAIKYFIPFDNGQSLSCGGNVEITDSDVFGAGASGIRLGLGGFLAYYPTKYWTLRTDIAYENFSDNDYKYRSELVDLTARYYILEALSVSLRFAHMYGKDEIGKISGPLIGLGIRARF